MTEEIRQLIFRFYSGEIDREGFVSEYFEGNKPKAEFVSELLKRAIAMRDEETLEEGMALIFTGYFPNTAFVTALSLLLSQSWHRKHEDTAMLLKEIASPVTVECLYNAVGLEFSYLAYDDTYQFARKCIKALAAIGNGDALERLRSLSGHEVPEVAAYARKELSYKEG